MPLLRTMIPRLIILLAGFAVSNLGARTVVANYRNDFNPSGAPKAGWSYLWNAPDGWAVGATGDQASGFIGAPTGYRALTLFESAYYADGDATGGNNAPSGFLRLSSTGGHPGMAAGTVNKRARYAIAAFTVPASGLYAIETSSLSVTSTSSDGVEVLVFPGKSEAVLRKVVTAAAADSFDVEIGYLDAGQTIYVAFGPGTTATSDAFLMDFSVVHYDRLSFKDQLTSGISSALSSGSGLVTITPGRYYANPASTYVALANINPAVPITIVADGVELVNQSLNRVIGFTNCHNLTLRGLSIDFDPQLYRQGTVEAINSNTFQLRLHEGYPQTLTSAATSGIIYEAANFRMKQLTDTLYPTAVTQIEPGLFSVTNNSSLSNMAVGDHVSLTESGGIPHTLYLEDCKDMRLENVEIHGSPAFAFLCWEGERITLDGVSVTPGKTPLRASVQRLLSSNADGLHFKSSLGQIHVTNCHLAYNGDDCIILTSSYSPIIQKPQANTIVVAVKATQETLNVGDSLYLYNPNTGTRESSSIQSITKVTSLTKDQIWALITPLFPDVKLSGSTFSQAWQITLPSGVNAPVGGWIADRSGDSTDFEISNCTIENTRARGILIKASNGIVRNNYIYNTFLAGIQLRPEPVVWMEGDFAQNVTIQDNELRRCAIARSNANAPINITSEGFENWTPGTGHSNISIIRNKFYNSPSASIYIQYADDVKIRSNQFTTTHNFLGQSPRFTSVIQLQNTNNVQILGLNTAMAINQTNANMSALVGTGAKVTGLTVNAGIVVSADQDLLPDAWESQYFGNTTAANADADTDGDGLTNYQEFLAGLNPLNVDEISVSLEMGSQTRIRWNPISNRYVTIYATDSLGTGFTVLAQDIPGERGYYDLPAIPPSGKIFYKIGINN